MIALHHRAMARCAMPRGGSLPFARDPVRHPDHNA